jgi:hypothetical protein
MNAQKADFLKHQFIPLLQKIPSGFAPQWGKMTFQQMVEHFADAVRMASGKTVYLDIVTPEDQLDKFRHFLKSDKPFRENTKNPILAEVPPPVRNPTLNDAIEELQEELHFFFTVFEKNHLIVTRNPVFGDLNFEENIQLLHKHALHHLRQFGINTSSLPQA